MIPCQLTSIFPQLQLLRTKYALSGHLKWAPQRTRNFQTFVCVTRAPTGVLKASTSCPFGVAPPGSDDGRARAVVMQQLLECYARVGGGGARRLLRVDGTPVAAELLALLRVELEDWTAKEGTKERRHINQQERPSIKAESYMILRAPVRLQ